MYGKKKYLKEAPSEKSLEDIWTASRGAVLAVRLSRINNKPEMGMAGAALGSGPHAGTRLCRSDYALGMM